MTGRADNDIYSWQW